MPFNFDVACVGDAKIDIFLYFSQGNTRLKLLKDTNELCLKFGEKISVDKARHLLGGDAANVSVGLSRQGLETALVAELGDDLFSQKIIDGLTKEKVATNFIQKSLGQEASFSVIISFEGERTIFSEHVTRAHNFNFENIATKWVYLTSLGNEWKDTYNKTLEFVEKTNCHLAFNPGTLQINGDFKDIEKQISRTDILFLNKEEAITVSEGVARLEGLPTARMRSAQSETSGALAGRKGGTGPRDIKDLLMALQKLGPKVVVITDGANGSFAMDENGNFFEQGTIPTQIAERTGAGDAYSSGFLSATLNSKTIQQAMEMGAKNAASVISNVGAQTGLLYAK